MTPAKWLFIQDLPVFPSLDYIILTEHQLSAEFRPDEIIKSGWDFHAVSGGRFVLFFTQQKERKKKRPMGGVGVKPATPGVFLVQSGRFLVVQKFIYLNLGSNI